MSKAERENFKKEVNAISEKIFAKITPNGARIISVILTTLVLVLFLATTTGRNIISFVAYVFFACIVLCNGRRFYKYSESHAKGVLKPKKVVNDIEPQPVDTEPEVPEDSFEFKPVDFEDVSNEDDTKKESEPVQLTFEDVIAEEEKAENKDDTKEE